MRAVERRELIAEWAQSGGVNVDDLSQRLNVSVSTIRRDLAVLTGNGRLMRVYGGAVGPQPWEPTLHERERSAQPAKDAIGRFAASLIEPGETVIIDAGTTTGRLAYHIRERSGLTVITNGLTALNMLADAEEIAVVVLGGMLRHISQGVIGSFSEQMLRHFTASRAFLGADAVVAGRGVCEAEPAQCALKEQMARQADEVYVLADASKLGQAPFRSWAPLDRPWTLITDDQAAEEQLTPFRETPGVSVITAPIRAVAGPGRGRLATGGT
jgi:DeoR/GlpR family transcriptional regulator of sugar metabolism